MIIRAPKPLLHGKVEVPGEVIALTFCEIFLFGYNFGSYTFYYLLGKKTYSCTLMMMVVVLMMQ